MEETANRIEEQIEKTRDVYHEGRKAVNDLARRASDQSRKALAVADEWVHGNPWAALGIVAGAGLILGLLFSRGHEYED